jgi:hypothetical protein
VQANSAPAKSNSQQPRGGSSANDKPVKADLTPGANKEAAPQDSTSKTAPISKAKVAPEEPPVARTEPPSKRRTEVPSTASSTKAVKATGDTPGGSKGKPKVTLPATSENKPKAAPSAKKRSSSAVAKRGSRLLGEPEDESGEEAPVKAKQPAQKKRVPSSSSKKRTSHNAADEAEDKEPDEKPDEEAEEE